MSDVIEILAAGPQPSVGVSPWFDASAYAALRLNLLASADHGTVLGADVRFFIETAVTETATIVPLWKAQYSSNDAPGQPYAWQANTRILLSGFDDLVRLRWEGRAEGLNLALAGEALPESE